MKRTLKITKLFSALFLFSILNASNLYAQCNSADYTETCISSLDSAYNYIKSFPLDGQNGAAEFEEHSYVFTQDTEYLINWCSKSENGGGISLEVMDKNRTSLANSADQPGSSQLKFTCTSTGIYYLKYSFGEGGDSCGGSAMGFKPAGP